MFLIALYPIAGVHAANEAEIGTSVEPDGIFRAITEGESMAPITFHLSEQSGEYAAPIMLYTDDLEEAGGARSIEKSLISITLEGDLDATQRFMLNKSAVYEITLTVKTQNVKPGTYAGKITIHADNATDKEVPLKIQVSQPVEYAAVLNLVGVTIGIAFTVLGIVLPKTRAAGDMSFSGFKKQFYNQFSVSNLLDNLNSVVAFFLVLFVVWATAFTAYYPKIVAFGANPILDYLAVILFGFAQVGASKITADMFKKK